VYDSAHMGHARAYVSFDIVRRILEDFFGFHVKYVMNVTDLDDKIIVRARRNHLLSQYQRDKLAHFGHQQVCEVIDDITRAFSLSIASLNAKCIDYLRVKSRRSVHEADKKQQVDEFKLSCLKLEYEHFGAVATSAVAATTAGKGEFKVTSVEQQAVILQQLIDAGKDVLGDMLDSTLGASVTDLGIFEAHARRYELEFLRDMRALGVRDASVVTRVSEYVPKIIDFVQDIVKKDMAYEALTNNKVHCASQGHWCSRAVFCTDLGRKGEQGMLCLV
jgi:cysteinyl-tRNA synthetase